MWRKIFEKIKHVSGNILLIHHNNKQSVFLIPFYDSPDSIPHHKYGKNEPLIWQILQVTLAVAFS